MVGNRCLFTHHCDTDERMGIQRIYKKRKHVTFSEIVRVAEIERHSTKCKRYYEEALRMDTIETFEDIMQSMFPISEHVTQ